jgi:DNA-binding LacI/PurR family transcriptional regulator
MLASGEPYDYFGVGIEEKRVTMSGLTMDEIAQMAGVSIGTVLRVVNNKDKVHPKTRARIQDLIDRVGYRPSAAAQALASRRTNNIMLVVPNITDDYYPNSCRARLHDGRPGRPS